MGGSTTWGSSLGLVQALNGGELHVVTAYAVTLAVMDGGSLAKSSGTGTVGLSLR